MKPSPSRQQLVSSAGALRPSAFLLHPLFFAALAALILSWLSVLHFAGYNAGMLDLGNMAQAVASALRGRPLVFTYVDGPTSRLAFHVELIYYLFALPYALWPDPRVLLIGQALLFASGALPAFRLGLRASGSAVAARCLALIYLLYPVALTAVLFDFHGDTLAMPLLLWALDAADRRDWRSYALWLALALSCKFYVALPAALLGALLWWQGQRRAGAATFLAAAAYGALAFLVIRPLFTTANTSQAHRGLNYLSFYFGQFGELWSTLGDRQLSALVLLVPALPLAWRGRQWLLPAAPLAAAALLSTGPGGAYDYRYHHYATVVPFIVMACAEGLRARQRSPRGLRQDAPMQVGIVLIFTALLVDTPLNPFFYLAPPGQGLDDSAYGSTPRDRMKDQWLAQNVPPQAPLAASIFLGPHLVNRDTVYSIRYPDDPGAQRLPAILPRVDYALADALFDWRTAVGGDVVGGPTYERDAIGLLLQRSDFGLVAARDGLLLFRRGAAPLLPQQIEPVLADAPPPALHTFADGLELVERSLEPLPPEGGARRLRASFTWRALRPLTGAPLVAVSRIEGVENARFVHLPSYVLLPASQWQPGQLVRETFVVELPKGLAPGRYAWRTGWYVASAPNAARTDAESRFGDEAAADVDL
jgi:uncharacterized membrane protein